MPPARPPARPHAGAPAQARRCSAGEGEPGCPACLLAPRPPARSRRRCAASSSPSLFSVSSFASSGDEVSKPAPASGGRRELKQETPSQGENPGGVEKGEGSCWNLSVSTQPLGLPGVPAPPSLAPNPLPPPSLGVPTSPRRSPSPIPEGTSPLGDTFSTQQQHGSFPGQSRKSSKFPVVVSLSIYRNEEKPQPVLAKPIRKLKQMNLLGFHPGDLSAKKLALLEMAVCQNHG